MTANDKQRDHIAANLKLTAEAHSKMRKLAKATGLTNSEIVDELLTQTSFKEAEAVLKRLVERKKQERQERLRLRREVDSMPPDRVREILESLKTPAK